MFKQTDAQRSLMSPELVLGPKKAARLEKTWAHAFRTLILPMIVEEKFAPLYHERRGAPCKSVRAQLCILLFREMFNLTDEQALEQFEWNLLWHYAMDVKPEQAHLVRKTLYNFRQRLMGSDGPRQIFTDLADALIECGEIDVSFQRQDSTHIVSNVRQLTRLGLFVETIEAFWADANAADEEMVAELPPRFEKRYGPRSGAFGDVKSARVQRRIQACAEDLWYLLQYFDGHPEIQKLDHWDNLCRLFEEQCVVVEDEGAAQAVTVRPAKQAPDANDDGPEPPDSPSGKATAQTTEATVEEDAEDPAASETSSEETSPSSQGQKPQASSQTIELKKSSEIATDSLQTPHDPDLSYGHKGVGYEVQISETCAEGNAFQLLTHVKTTPSNGSDQNEVMPTLDALAARGHTVSTLLVDRGYICAANIIASDQRGVDLLGPMKGAGGKEELLKREEFLLRPSKKGFVPIVEACPEGHPSVGSDVTTRNENIKIHSRFSRDTCEKCPKKELCPVMRHEVLFDRRNPGKVAERHKNPALRSSPKDLVVALRRQRQETPEFKEKYRIRAGIEGTNSEMKRAHGLDDLTVRGRRRVEVDVYMKAGAVNIKRMLQAYMAGKLDLAAARERVEEWAEKMRKALVYVLFHLLRLLSGRSDGRGTNFALNDDAPRFQRTMCAIS